MECDIVGRRAPRRHVSEDSVSKTLRLVPQAVSAFAERSVCEDDSHAASLMCVRFSEDAYAGVLLREDITQIVLWRAVIVLVGKHDSRRSGVLKLYVMDRQTEHGAQMELKL